MDEWLADYAREIDNLRTAVDWAFSPSGDASIGVGLTAAGVPLWLQLSMVGECLSCVEQALAWLAREARVDVCSEMKLQAALGASLLFTKGATAAAGQACATALWTCPALVERHWLIWRHVFRTEPGW
jgi:hypothetical protein